MCFVDMEKAFDRVSRKVMNWVMRKKGLLEVMVRAVISLCDGAETRVRVGSKSWYTARICAVATIVCNSYGRWCGSTRFQLFDSRAKRTVVD